ncbi:hypothetical protein [Sphingomicrobium nitratireducens]|uniref:hypothetical protein n=1 Tax=Sphingomicrobium nitratireducens TaxID=2964666 RepID=UPI00223F2BCD|nr:hypothetical protein [Sphingomicrobium nitratireducens]
MSPKLISELEHHARDVFARLKTATLNVHRDEAEIFAPEDPVLRLHTPLATGADQIAAMAARVNGYRVRAMLPFAIAEYEKDFADPAELAEFRSQLEATDERFALPGTREMGDEAYVRVGKAVIAAADILVAIWDGGEGNGPGGTAHVVDLALRAGAPVLQLIVDHEGDTVTGRRLMVGGDAIEPIEVPLDGQADYDKLVRTTLAPHSEIGRQEIATFYSETEKRTNWRIEYPLMLALLRVKKLGKPWRQSSIQDDIDYEWSAVRESFPASARMPLERAYGWSNFLAIRYAQFFRSGHVTNYALSALAVFIALTGLIFPAAKLYLVVAELSTIGLIYLNTGSGKDGDWHRRWLQYRHLAETLRPLVYLKRTGVAGPPFRSDYIKGPLHREAGADWTRWYASAIWREMTSPTGETGPETIRKLADHVIEEQVKPQAAYHRVNAERMHHLDHKLHEVGNFLMGAVIAACFLFIVGYFIDAHAVKKVTNYFVLITAGLPAAGAAVFGLRGHGEHLLASSRSANSANALDRNARRLAELDEIDKLARELERTAAIMLSDLNEWTTSYREKSLEVPA